MPFSFLSSAELTDIGKKRKNNEDAVFRYPGQGLFCVSDGMGGAQDGEVASRIVVESLARHASVLDATIPGEEMSTLQGRARLIQNVLDNASREIRERAEARGHVGTGATVTLLIFAHDTYGRAMILHGGDSRVYRYRKGKLKQLTTDHSLAAAAGIEDEKTLPARFRGIVTRAVGLEHTIRLDKVPVSTQAGDLFILCSDGLTRMVPDKGLAKLLRHNATEEVAVLARLLIDEANNAGGNDNISAIVIRVGDHRCEDAAVSSPPETYGAEYTTSETDTAYTPVTAPAPGASHRTPREGRPPVAPNFGAGVLMGPSSHGRQSGDRSAAPSAGGRRLGRKHGCGWSGSPARSGWTTAEPSRARVAKWMLRGSLILLLLLACVGIIWAAMGLPFS